MRPTAHPPSRNARTPHAPFGVIDRRAPAAASTTAGRCGRHTQEWMLDEPRKNRPDVDTAVRVLAARFASPVERVLQHTAMSSSKRVTRAQPVEMMSQQAAQSPPRRGNARSTEACRMGAPLHRAVEASTIRHKILPNRLWTWTRSGFHVARMRPRGRAVAAHIRRPSGGSRTGQMPGPVGAAPDSMPCNAAFRRVWCHSSNQSATQQPVIC